MPADRLALAVGIGGEDQRVGLLGLIGDRLELPDLVRIGLPFHGEALVRVDRSVPRRQIADMTIARQHAVTGAQIFLDGFRLGGRFDDDQFQKSACPYVYTRDGERAALRPSSGEADLAPGVAVETAGEVEFEQDELDRAARQCGLADQLVDRHR